MQTPEPDACGRGDGFGRGDPVMQRRTLRDSARRPRAGRVLVVLLPLTSGRRERFQALCADAGAWIIIRAPQRACGLSWFRQSSGDGFVYFPWKRRIRKVDAREWAAREQFGMPVALAELFDVVCQSGVVATAQGGFIPMDRQGGWLARARSCYGPDR